jgi:hypothetical protein
MLQLGGVINPTDCMEVASPSTLTRLGDVCVSPFSNNWYVSVLSLPSLSCLRHRVWHPLCYEASLFSQLMLLFAHIACSPPEFTELAARTKSMTVWMVLQGVPIGFLVAAVWRFPEPGQYFR